MTRLPSIHEEEHEDEDEDEDEVDDSNMTKMMKYISICINKKLESQNMVEIKYNIEKRINDLKMYFSMIIDIIKELDISKKSNNTEFINFYSNFSNLVNNYEKYKLSNRKDKLTQIKKLLTQIKKLAEREYSAVLEVADYRVLKQYIKQYTKEVHRNQDIMRFQGCKNFKYIYENYLEFITNIEDKLLSNNYLKGNKIFDYIYNIYFKMSELEILIEHETENKATRGGGKKKSRRKPRKLNKRKSIRKKSRKRNRRTRKY